GDEPDEQHADHQQRGGDREPDEWCGDSPFHDQGSFCGLLAASLSGGGSVFAVRGLTSAPSVSRYWPEVTTRSPLARPLRTTLCVVPSSPTSMSRFSTLLSGPTTNAYSPFGPCWIASLAITGTFFRVSTRRRVATESPGHNASSLFWKVAFMWIVPLA